MVGWANEAKRRISELSLLEANWDSYGASPVDQASINLAIEFVTFVNQIPGVPEPRIAASPAGNVGLTWEWDDFNQELDIELDPVNGICVGYIDSRCPDDDFEMVIDNRFVKLAAVLGSEYVKRSLFGVS